MTLNDSKKRTFSQFQFTEDQSILDLSSSSPEPKKQKLNHFQPSNPLPLPPNPTDSPNRSPSIEIISFTPATTTIPTTHPIDSKPSFSSRTDNKENNGDINNSTPTSISPVDDTRNNNNSWITDSNCKIIEHRIENEWYEFKIESLLNKTIFGWYKHSDLEHLNIYNKYLRQCNLSLSEASEKSYIVEQIIEHETDTNNETHYLVKWKGYSNDHNSWEPHSHLKDVETYIQYCKQHNIELPFSDNDDSSSEYEEEEILSEIENEHENEISVTVSDSNKGKDSDYTIDTNDENEHENEDNNNDCKDIEIIDITNDDDIFDNDGNNIDIEYEYKMAMKENKEFNCEYIMDIMNTIDKRMEILFNEPMIIDHNCNNNNNNKNVKNKQIEMNKLMDIRQYFETLKGELLFKKYQNNNKYNGVIDGMDKNINTIVNQFGSNNNSNNNNNNNNNTMDIDGGSDDDIQIIEPLSKINVETPIKKRKTLFDYYSFTPKKTKQSPLNKNKNINKNKNKTINTIAKNKNKNKNKSEKKKRRKKQTHFAINRNIIDITNDNYNENNNHNINENGCDIPIEYLSQTNTCYSCKRKWPLFAIEFFKAFPICNTCPKHIRLGYIRQKREDWFCPYCHHSAQCVLFPSLIAESEDNYNGIPLYSMCKLTNKPFLYIKPNDSNYWKTYILLDVYNITTGEISVKDSNRRGNKTIEICLNNINNKQWNILWAYNNIKINKLKQYNAKDVTSVMSFNDKQVVIKLGRNKSPITVNKAQVIICDKYLSKLLTQCVRKCRQKGIKFDREKVFKYSKHIKLQNKAKKLKKNRFGAGTIVKESAPMNSRYFDQNNNNNISEIIPNYEQTTKQLLQLFNIESVPEQLLKPPERVLKLSEIEKYPLTLIIGPSGSGKSTLLKSIQAQNPSLVTFINPNDLAWQADKCIISQFGNITLEKAMSYMSSIGLNNIRTWLKPQHICSTGEKYRCGMARLFMESVLNNNNNNNNGKRIILIDEYTSVLDPTTARCMATATGKCIRKNKFASNFILASGNIDILRYLQPNLLILLSGKNDMKLIENPNNLNNKNKLFDVKAILDLPPFLKRRDTDKDNELKSVQKLTVFDDLKPYKRPISIDKDVRELKCKVIMDGHAKETAKILDVEDFNGECVTHIPCLQEKHMGNSNWNIGIIVGPSGCGKTTSGERLFGRPKDIEWDYSRNIASHFRDIISFKELFIAVDLPLNIGFSYYNLLSEGEQHRVNIARYLNDNNNNVLIDEFTSYLDRITALKVAKGVSDYIYKYDKKHIVFLCCKYDIISGKNGIYPSWIFDVSNKKITHYKPQQKLNNNNSINIINKPLKLHAEHKLINIKNAWNPPKIRLVMKQTLAKYFSPTFSRYHYMDASINGAGKCFSVWAYFSYVNNNNNNWNNSNNKSDKEEASDSDEKDEEDIIMDDNNNNIDDGYYNENELELIGFTSFINHYGSNNVTMNDDSIKHINYREHRTVVLPSFQGLGFGSRIADCMGEYLSLHGQRLHSKTAHPRYGGYRNKQPSLWIKTKRNGIKQSRKQWKKDVDRMIFGGQLDSVGMEKMYYIHVYKLHNDKQRTERDNKLLKSRVIVKKMYKPLKE